MMSRLKDGNKLPVCSAYKKLVNAFQIGSTGHLISKVIVGILNSSYSTSA